MHADVPYDYQEFLSQGRWRAARAASALLLVALAFLPFPWALLMAAGVVAVETTRATLGPAAYRRYRAEWTRLGNGADPFRDGREDAGYFMDTGWRRWAGCALFSAIAVLIALRALSVWFLAAMWVLLVVFALGGVLVEVGRRRRLKSNRSGAAAGSTMQGA